MRSGCIAAMQSLTGRTVLAFMSANHIDPAAAAEAFLLEPEAALPVLIRSEARLGRGARNCVRDAGHRAGATP